MVPSGRAGLAAAAALVFASGLGLGGPVLPTATAAGPAPTPGASCGPGSIPEAGMQGRVAAADVAAGTVQDGYRCNIEVLGQFGQSGGYKVERYVDKARHECAFYDSTLLFPTNAANVDQLPTGTFVLDMTNPAKPVRTATLVTPAMQSPHESLLVNKTRGLLAAVAGNPLFAPGQVDVYDVSKDCRKPELLSTTPTGVLGHESGFAPDGKTFYAASLGGGTLTAVDLTDPRRPGIAYVGNFDTHAVTISDDGTRAYLAAGAGFPRNEVGLPAKVSGLVILDVSAIQQRRFNPQPGTISSTTWPNVTIPQAALPITIEGRPYLVEVDEFSTDTNGRIAANGPRVGAARIIDIADETKPRIVSDLRLAVHSPENRAALTGDPDATSFTGGYAGHYCAVPQRNDPGIVACSFLASGLRVFDIRDPLAPKEIAYFVAPVPPGGAANAAFSSASFVPERSEIWYTDGSRGFYALRVTNGAWPAATVAAQLPPPSAPAAPPAARPTGNLLAATGPAVPLTLGLALLLAGLLLRRALGRPVRRTGGRPVRRTGGRPVRRTGGRPDGRARA